jgi:Domain of unknown function (DUF4136)
MKIHFQLFFMVIIAMLFVGCQVRVKYSYDHSKDFGKYKTFCWMTGCEFKFTGPAYLNDSLLQQNLKRAIVEELKSKGLTEDTANPDLLVGFTITVNDEQAVIYHRAEDSPLFYKPLEIDREVVNYLKGTLIIGMADKNESSMVWESVAVSFMELNPDFSEKNIRKGIKLVLKDFPPPKRIGKMANGN